MKKYILLPFLLITLSLLHAISMPDSSGSVRQALLGFMHPQDSARTKIWWFHGKYPSRKDGMKEDLVSFKKIGIGGIVFYDQVHGAQEPGTEKAMSREWWDNLYYVANETKRLGLSFEFHVSNGFVAGGPWITPGMAMKRIECTDTIVSGGRRVNLHLKAPDNRYAFYKDIKVMAIPTKEDDDLAIPQYATNMPDFKPQNLFLGTELYSIPPTHDTPLYIYIDYTSPKTIRSISYLIGPSGKATTSATNIPGMPQEDFVGTGYRQLPAVGELQWSEDGEVYHKVCDLKPLYKAHESYKRKNISFLPVKARFYRLKLDGWDGIDEGRPLRLGHVTLSSDAKINEYEYKAGYISEYIEKSMNSPSYNSSDAIPLAAVHDITCCLDANGTLCWDVPPGRWRILRMCMVPTGGKTKHGRPDMEGLECDKMSVAAATLQFHSYFKQIQDSLNCHGYYNLSGMAMDSHEAGSQNWTDDFLAAFYTLRGYDLTPYLPVMAGYIIGDVRTSESVLCDVRLTIADLIAERYYGTFDRLCRENNMVFTAQATGNAQCIVAIPIVAKSKVQKPQGEFWVKQPDGNYDIKEASSSAHIYGKSIASAEAFTDGDATTMPSDLKNIADAAYSFGINEFVVCASAHQPLSVPGGNPGGRCYATYSRNNTWWDKSEAFWDYQARISYMMRQGRPVADLCVYLGNNAPVRILTHRLPKIPAGYDFDAFTEDALITRMRSDRGKIILPTGQVYSMMVLPRSGEISWKALKKIASLVYSGAYVYGNRPTGSPSLTDICHEGEYNALVDSMWNGRNYGKGRVFTGMTLEEALHKANIVPDVAGTKLYFCHREMDDGDLYFLNNHTDVHITGEYVFKTKYRYAQLWDAISGKRYALPYFDKAIKLEFAPRESYVIVFSNTKEDLPELPDVKEKLPLVGNWTLQFNGNHSGHKTIRCDSLTYWSRSRHRDIRYYSGTVIYKKKFNINTCDKSVQLQLPKNNCLTEVFVNGRKAGTIWCSPWTLDIGTYVTKGQNDLELHVHNSWNNRAIYDRMLPKASRLVPYAEQLVSEEATLQAAGLEGQVWLDMDK